MIGATMTPIELLAEWKERKDTISAREIIDGLAAANIVVEVKDGRLYFPRGTAPPEMLEIIAAREADVIEVLKAAEVQPRGTREATFIDLEGKDATE